MPRFVILRHETPAGYHRPTHYDLMLESGRVLRTWALLEEPHMGAEIPAEALGDHRLAYLNYEGEVSGERGAVERWDSGEYSLTSESASQLIVRLDGQRLRGELILHADPDRPRQWLAELREP